jgi:hypothetical protein
LVHIPSGIQPIFFQEKVMERTASRPDAISGFDAMQRDSSFQDSETPFHYPNIPNVHSTSCLMLSTHLLKRNSLYKLHLSEFMAKLSSVGIKAFQ